MRIGSLIRTSYGSEFAKPYTVERITTGCTCPEYVRKINGDETPSEEHTHFRVTAPGAHGFFYLNGYKEVSPTRWNSVWNDDYLIVLDENPNGAMDLFLDT